MDLFRWQAEARAVAQLDEKIAAVDEAIVRCKRVLFDTLEHREVEAIKEKLADAKRDALARDPDVVDVKAELKAARAKMKDTAAGPLGALRDKMRERKPLLATRSETAERVVKGVAK